jgi:L-glyceraldehyde 3-phosphate reductase
MFERGIENGLTDVLQQNGIGSVVFCPLAQGLLTNRYLAGIPADSRAGQDSRFFKPRDITEDKLVRLRRLEDLARQRGQSLAQLALVWVLRNPVVTSAIIGASKVGQIEENVQALQHPSLSHEEKDSIEAILGST